MNATQNLANNLEFAKKISQNSFSIWHILTKLGEELSLPYFSFLPAKSTSQKTGQAGRGKEERRVHATEYWNQLSEMTFNIWTVCWIRKNIWLGHDRFPTRALEIISPQSHKRLPAVTVDADAWNGGKSPLCLHPSSLYLSLLRQCVTKIAGLNVLRWGWGCNCLHNWP